MAAPRSQRKVERDDWPEPPALKSWCALCGEEVRITAGAVVLSDPPGVAHGSCARDPQGGSQARRRSSLAGWLLVVHALCVLGMLWAWGVGHIALALFLTFLAGLAIFFAWELEA